MEHKTIMTLKEIADAEYESLPVETWGENIDEPIDVKAERVNGEVITITDLVLHKTNNGCKMSFELNYMVNEEDIRHGIIEIIKHSKL